MKNLENYIKLILIAAILVVINIIANFVHGYIDLTEEKRFTLAESTADLLYELEDPIIIKILLEGNFPASFKRLQQATKEMVDEFRDENSIIEYVFDDPTEGDIEDVNARIKELGEKGIVGRSLTYFEGKEKVQRVVFPYAIIQYGDRDIVVNLLESASGQENEESMLNKSVSLLEYKLANAIQKITAKKQGNIVFTTGQGEIAPKYRASLRNELSRYYNIGDIPLDSITHIGQEADLVIVRVNMYWPSTIDTIQTKTMVDKTVLLATSKFTRYQILPMRLNFEILKTEPQPDQFNKGRQPVALMLEGEFPSFFENRVDASFEKTLQQINQPFQKVSKPTKQLIVSDVDFAANWFNERSQETYPMGYNPYLPKGQNNFQGNQDFMINAIEYMISDRGVLEARNREVKLRLLNGPKVREEKTKWQLINIGLPLLFIIVFGFVYNYVRRRKYSQ